MSKATDFVKKTTTVEAAKTVKHRTAADLLKLLKKVSKLEPHLKKK